MMMQLNGNWIITVYNWVVYLAVLHIKLKTHLSCYFRETQQFIMYEKIGTCICILCIKSHMIRILSSWSNYNVSDTILSLSLLCYRRSLVLELQTTRELLASSLKKVQDLELESRKVPTLENRIHELERSLSSTTPMQSGKNKWVHRGGCLHHKSEKYILVRGTQ